jgi:hypothetical protein
LGKGSLLSRKANQPLKGCNRGAGFFPDFSSECFQQEDQFRKKTRHSILEREKIFPDRLTTLSVYDKILE